MSTAPEKKISIWNKTFICCIFTNVFFSFSHQFTSPLISTYASYLGASATIVGMLSGLYFGVAFAARPFSGPIVTTQNKKYLMIATFALGAIVNVMYALFSSVPLFVMARLIHGIQYSFMGSLCLTVAAASLPKERIASGIGVFGIAGIFGMALGPSLGIALRDYGDRTFGVGGGFRLTFWVSAFFCALALIPCFLIQKQAKLTLEQRQALGPWYKNIVTKEAMPSAFMMLLYSMSFIIYSTFMVPYAAQYGIAGIGSFFTVYAFATLISRPLSGTINDKFGTKVIFIPCTALFAGSLLIVGFATSLPVLWVAAVMSAFGWGSIQPALQAMAMASVPTERGGVASNTNYFGLDLGYFLGPTLGGFVYAATGSYHIMFRCAIIPVLIGFILFIFFGSKMKRTTDKTETNE